MAKRILIVGGVAGGATAAARLRRNDEALEIILFERGEYISFANCGLPYYVGDVIAKRSALLLQTPERLRRRFNIDVRVRHEVVGIDRQSKRVTVRNLNDGSCYEERYDALILATGSLPAASNIRGSELPQVRTVATIADADAIVAQGKELKRAVIAGGGFIGVEMAENFRHRGMEVTLVELQAQVLSQFDEEMARPIQNALRAEGVNLLLGTGVREFARAEGERVSVRLSDGSALEADVVINAIGVRPNSELAVRAGLRVNRRGGIVVDERMRTSDDSIYAVGDVAEIERAVDGARVMVPLAGPANKQGRVVANVLAGIPDRYAGTCATSIVKLFSNSAAATGLNERALIQSGLARGRDYMTALIWQKSHAGYYPGARPMAIKLTFSMEGKLYGAQIFGSEGVDKRIDVIATALRLGGSVYDLKDLDLAYAPPYSSAKDPVNMAGYVAENVLSGMVKFADWNVDLSDGGKVLLDVREDREREAFAIPGTLNIPMDQLRDRIGEIDAGRGVVIFCAAGIRAYNAARLLMQKGYSSVCVYPGGTSFYRLVTGA